MEKKTEKPKGFLESKEFLDLKKEIVDSVEGVLASGGEDDLEPVMRLFNKQTADRYPNEASREELFWGIVAESLRDGEFRKIHTEIGPLLEEATAAEAFLSKKLSGIISRLSSTIYRSSSMRANALRGLKAKFYEYFPEIRGLIFGGQEGKRPGVKVPGGRFVEREEQEKWNRGDEAMIRAWEEEERGKPHKYPRFTEKRTWPIPDWGDIKAGLVVEWTNREWGYSGSFKVLGPPHEDERGWWVRVEIITSSSPAETAGEIKETSLADRGIVSYKRGDRSGEWNNWIRPTRWYREKKEPVE